MAGSPRSRRQGEEAPGGPVGDAAGRPRRGGSIEHIIWAAAPATPKALGIVMPFRSRRSMTPDHVRFECVSSGGWSTSSELEVVSKAFLKATSFNTGEPARS